MGSTTRSPGPELVITGAPSRNLARSLLELPHFRDTILAFAERDVRVKYKQAILGIAWAVIQPLAFMAIFTLTLGRVANVSTGDVPYAAFSLSALVVWTFISTAVSFGSNALLIDAAMVRRVYFPREVPVLGSAVSATVDLLIGFALFMLIGPLLGARVTAWWLLAPILYLPLAVVAVSVAIPLAAMNVYYRDFRFALPFAMQLWLFASPVAYPLANVPAHWRTAYVLLNPASGILDSYSNILAYGRAPDPLYLGMSVASAVVIGSSGYYLFKRLEPNFADVI
jgi:ABC-type polysaccharide/polyol phosphate export permease